MSKESCFRSIHVFHVFSPIVIRTNAFERACDDTAVRYSIQTHDNRSNRSVFPSPLPPFFYLLPFPRIEAVAPQRVRNLDRSDKRSHYVVETRLSNDLFLPPLQITNKARYILVVSLFYFLPSYVFGGAFGFTPSPLQQFANSRQVGFIFPGTVASPRRNGAIGSVQEVSPCRERERRKRGPSSRSHPLHRMIAEHSV